MDHIIGKKKNWCGNGYKFTLNNQELLVFSGGVNSVHNFLDLLSSLYDEYQTSDKIKEDDNFVLNGVVFASCVDVHVIPTKEGEQLIHDELNQFKQEINKKDKNITIEMLKELNEQNILRLHGQLNYTNNNLDHYKQLMNEQKIGYREY